MMGEPARLAHAGDLVGDIVEKRVVDLALRRGERRRPDLNHERTQMGSKLPLARPMVFVGTAALARGGIVDFSLVHQMSSSSNASSAVADSNSNARPTMRISSPSAGARLLKRLLHADALEAVLQERDGVLVFPVGLHNHALNLAALHAEDAVGELGAP